MTVPKKPFVICRIRPDHPSGQYIAQGYKLLPTWQMIEDDADIVASLIADPNVVCAAPGSREWCVTQGIEFTAKNLAELGFDEHGQPLKSPEQAKTSATPPQVRAQRVEQPKEEKTQHGANTAQKEAKPRSKAEIIAILEGKGKVAGKDFDKDASFAALQALLASC